MILVHRLHLHLAAEFLTLLGGHCRQIYLQIRAAILSQNLAPGTKLPSTRALAAQLSVSRSAVVSAYEQLLAAREEAA